MVSVPDFIPIFPVCRSLSGACYIPSMYWICFCQRSVLSCTSAVPRVQFPAHLSDESQGTCASPSFSTFASTASSKGQATVAKLSHILGS